MTLVPPLGGSRPWGDRWHPAGAKSLYPSPSRGGKFGSWRRLAASGGLARRRDGEDIEQTGGKPGRAGSRQVRPTEGATAVSEARRAEIGIFGGSGFYSLAGDVEEVWVETPYGPPSDRVALTTVGGRKVAFLPRHGRDHRYPPHRINYRANLWAMKELGVTRIIGPCAAGSLQPDIPPGTFVLCDQFVNRTWGRADTFFDGPVTTHISAADPYCPQLREAAAGVCARLGVPHRREGTVVVVQGPRFSTRAESREFRERGWQVINMTQYPEVILARELGMCYLNISLITDYDVGLEGHPDVRPVTHQEVLRVFQDNLERLRRLLWELIPAIPPARTCACGQAVQQARGH